MSDFLQRELLEVESARDDLRPENIHECCTAHTVRELESLQFKDGHLTISSRKSVPGVSSDLCSVLLAPLQERGRVSDPARCAWQCQSAGRIHQV